MILEIRLPPLDFYKKLLSIIYELNIVFRDFRANNFTFSKIGPISENIAFSSINTRSFFTLKSFVEIYSNKYLDIFKLKDFHRWLWHQNIIIQGENIIYSSTLCKSLNFTSLTFILNPIYKLFNLCLAEHPIKISKFLKLKLFKNIHIIKNLNYRDILNLILERIFCSEKNLSYVIYRYFPNPTEAMKRIWENYLVLMNKIKINSSIVVQSIYKIKSIFMNIKLYSKNETNTFYFFGRLIQGSMKYKIRYSSIKQNRKQFYLWDKKIQILKPFNYNRILLGKFYQAKPLKYAFEGNIILIEILKTKDLNYFDFLLIEINDFINLDKNGQIFKNSGCTFKNVFKFNNPTMRIAVSPLKPKQMLDLFKSLKKVSKIFTNCKINLEDSGEYFIDSCGELSLNLIIKSICDTSYSGIFLRISDPFITIRETIHLSSQTKSFASTLDKQFKIEIIANKLNTLDYFDEKHTNLNPDNMRWTTNEKSIFSLKKNILYFSKNVWYFSSEQNIRLFLINNLENCSMRDELSMILKKKLMKGFLWASNEGPLCNEPLANIVLRIINISKPKIYTLNQIGSITLVMKKACLSSILLSSPRLLEPYLQIEILLPSDCLKVAFNILFNRRAILNHEYPREGTCIYSVGAFLPLIDSIGLETDLKFHTQGQSFLIYYFYGWNKIPGDPLNFQSNIKNKEKFSLANEFLTKIRKRKGLTPKPQISYILDDQFMLDLLLKSNQYHY